MARVEAGGIIRIGRKHGLADSQIKTDLIATLNVSAADAEQMMNESSAS